MSSLFDALGNRGGNYTNPMEAVQQLKADPIGFMKSRGFNLPNGVDTRNPQSIINGLIQSGQVKNTRYQQILQMMGGMPRR